MEWRSQKARPWTIVFSNWAAVAFQAGGGSGDGRVDAEIELAGVFSLESGNFIL